MNADTLLYTIAVGPGWARRAEALRRSAYDAGWDGAMLTHTEPDPESNDPNLLKFALTERELDKYRWVLYVDSDCLFNRNPGELVGPRENRFARDLISVGDGTPLSVKYGTRLMSSETIRKRKGFPTVNAGIWCVGVSDYLSMSSFVNSERWKHSDKTAIDQLAMNKYLFECSDFLWNYYEEGTIAYGMIGVKKYPGAVLNHYIGCKHLPMDGEIERRYPDLVPGAALSSVEARA